MCIYILEPMNLSTNVSVHDLEMYVLGQPQNLMPTTVNT